MDGGKVSSSSPNVIVDIINSRILTAIVTLVTASWFESKFFLQKWEKSPYGVLVIKQKYPFFKAMLWVNIRR